MVSLTHTIQYMLLLGVSTVTMFAITVAAIAIPRSFQSSLFYNTWTRLDKAQKASVQVCVEGGGVFGGEGVVGMGMRVWR